MAKRKPARPVSRTRTPGAARAGKAVRATGRSARKATTAAARKGTTRKRAAAAQKKAVTKSAPQASGARSQSRRPVARTTARPATSRPPARPVATKMTRPSTRGTRTLVTKRQPARRQSASAPARRDYGARGSKTRLQQIERDRRIVEEEVPTPPSSLDLDRRPSAARSGRAEMEEKLQEHTSTGPDLTAGDVDADWEAAYNTGDEAPGGDMPTPDQAVVGEIGTAIGVEYADNEELKGVDKIEERDRHRWELDPASSEDYQDRARETKKKG